MNDIQELRQKLIEEVKHESETFGPSPVGILLQRAADALEALNRENETMTTRVVEYLDAHEHPDDWGVTCVYTRGLRALLAGEVSS